MYGSVATAIHAIMLKLEEFSILHVQIFTRTSWACLGGTVINLVKRQLRVWSSKPVAVKSRSKRIHNHDVIENYVICTCKLDVHVQGVSLVELL